MARICPQRLHRAEQVPVRISQRFPLHAADHHLLLRWVQHHWQSKNPKPQGGEHHCHPHIQTVFIRHTKQSHRRIDKTKIKQHQQNNAANVARSPPQTRNETTVLFCRQVVKHRIVVDRSELEENVTRTQQSDPQPQSTQRAQWGFGGNKIHERQRKENQQRKPAHHLGSIPRPVRPLPRNRS